MFKQQIEVEFYLNACVGLPKNMRMEVWERIAIDERKAKAINKSQMFILIF